MLFTKETEKILKNKRDKKSTGLVVGRFYPYHKGHKFLLEEALKQVDTLYIIIVGRVNQTIPWQRRAEWISNSLDSPRIILVGFDQDAVGLADLDPEGWAAMAIDKVGYPDRVFCSESYQKDFAKNLRAELVVVDESRKNVPVSGTGVRNNPLDHKELLEPEVFADIQAYEALAHDSDASRFA